MDLWGSWQQKQLGADFLRRGIAFEHLFSGTLGTCFQGIALPINILGGYTTGVIPMGVSSVYIYIYEGHRRTEG